MDGAERQKERKAERQKGRKKERNCMDGKYRYKEIGWMMDGWMDGWKRQKEKRVSPFL